MSKTLTTMNSRGQRIELSLNPESMVVRVGKKSSRLTTQEYLLLDALARTPGSTLSRSRLLCDVWQCAMPIKTRTVDVHVQRLRSKLGHHVIETVHGVGYRLKTPVSLPCAG